MKYALVNNIYLISIVDEQTYLKKRFYYNKEILVPNEIWFSEKILLKIFLIATLEKNYF